MQIRSFVYHTIGFQLLFGIEFGRLEMLAAYI